jgi:uncharacterized repeat protein (TIGR02543 family)
VPPEPPPTGTGMPPVSSPSPAPPTLRITVSTKNPMVGEDVTLKVTDDKGIAPAGAHWDFGDGQQMDGPLAQHHWADARTFQVSVQATMLDGQQATTSTGIDVSAIPKVTLTVTTPANGSVTGAGISCPPTCTASVDKGQSVSLTARAAANFTFTGWSGACTGTGTCKVLLTGDQTVTASFESVLTPFVGFWKNVDPGTRSIPQAQLTQTSPTTAALHVWGTCHPTFCDWGTTTATLSGGELHAFYDQGFATDTIRISAVNGQLVIRDHCHFTDNSGRQDFDSVDTMRKG